MLIIKARTLLLRNDGINYCNKLDVKLLYVCAHNLNNILNIFLKMKRINLELNDELYDKIKKISQERDSNVSVVIREAIEVFNDEKIETETGFDSFFELPEVCQIEGPGDLSINHDKYLYDMDDK
ncbi:MAG: ribbon-helix-helix domain-containing protein [Candidatus Humimicrobiaceae bacterium]